MSVARVREVTASSKSSFQDAVQQGISRAIATYGNIEGAVVQAQKVVVEDGKIACYRATLKLTFIVTD